jgi:hypothetical protein
MGMCGSSTQTSAAPDCTAGIRTRRGGSGTRHRQEMPRNCCRRTPQTLVDLQRKTDGAPSWNAPISVFQPFPARTDKAIQN